MLQQTQVATVIPYYNRWLRRFPSFDALSAAVESDVLHAWEGLGYYSRARNLHALARTVATHYAGKLPHQEQAIRGLPGVGRYTANAVLSFAFDQAVPIVEANVGRVLARVFNIAQPIDTAPGREDLWRKAATLVPDNQPARFNSALMDLGALVCRKLPQCRCCPIRRFCRAPRPELLPRKKASPPVKRLTECHSLVRSNGRILLEQCSSRWRGMWMLPRIHSGDHRAEPPIYSAVFPFTHHQITLQVFRPAAENDGATRNRTGSAVGRFRTLNHRPPATRVVRWFRLDRLPFIPLPSPHRRAIQSIIGEGPEIGR